MEDLNGSVFPSLSDPSSRRVRLLVTKDNVVKRKMIVENGEKFCFTDASQLTNEVFVTNVERHSIQNGYEVVFAYNNGIKEFYQEFDEIKPDGTGRPKMFSKQKLIAKDRYGNIVGFKEVYVEPKLKSCPNRNNSDFNFVNFSAKPQHIVASQTNNESEGDYWKMFIDIFKTILNLLNSTSNCNI